MYAYILDNRDLAIKDVLEFENHNFQWDIDYDDKSSITVIRQPVIEDDDFVICKNDNEIIFQGICENCKAASERELYTISLIQIEQLFSRQIFVGNENLISETGIEDFIASEISANFTASGDSLTDKLYMTVTAESHTPIAAKVDAENGIYNLKTYLGNVRQYYGICLDFVFNGSELGVTINRKAVDKLPIDTGISDISGYNETYEISVLAKLVARWKIPDKAEAIGEETTRVFYLLADRTVTENGANEDRAKGLIKSIRIETETEDEMLQQVYNEFSSNAYNHKITFSIRGGSQCYPARDLYIGRKCLIKTCAGVKESLITGLQKGSSSDLLSVTFGTLKVTLIEKLRRQ